MAYDTTEAVAKFLSGFQMKITNRERDTVAPDYYVKYSLTLSKGGKDFSTTFVSDPGASGEPTVTQVFSALADDALTLRKRDAGTCPCCHPVAVCPRRKKNMRSINVLP